MHRLAARAGPRRARGQNRPPDGLDNDQEWRIARPGFEWFRHLRDIGSKPALAQHDLSALSVAVVVLRAKSSRLTDLEPLVPKLLIAIEAARPGTAVVVREEKD
jgi:hypothetical protein